MTEPDLYGQVVEIPEHWRTGTRVGAGIIGKSSYYKEFSKAYQQFAIEAIKVFQWQNNEGKYYDFTTPQIMGILHIPKKKERLIRLWLNRMCKLDLIKCSGTTKARKWKWVNAR